MPELGLKVRWNRRDRILMEAAEQLQNTPLFNPVFWSVALGVAAAILALRRVAASLVILAVSSLLFALGFGAIGISCDLRYVYIIPVAATMLLFAVTITSGAEAADATTADRNGRMPDAR